MSFLRGLKFRLALSHTLPVLIFVAVLGGVLLYRLQRTYLIDNFAVELAAQGSIIAQFIRDEPAIWRQPALAQILIDSLAEQTPTHLMLITPQGRAIAANWFGATGGTTAPINSPVVERALQGAPSWRVDSGAVEQVIDVAVPVLGSGGRIVGAIRLSAPLQEVQRRLAPIRWIIILTLVFGAILSLALGFMLARSLARPLLNLTQAVGEFSPASATTAIEEVGPREVRQLAASFNQMSRRLHDLERTRAALLSGIVHELGRPLGAIKAAAQTIHNSHDITLQHDLAEGIDDQVDRLRLQLEDLVLLSTMELQGLDLNLDVVDLSPLIHDVCAQFRHQAREKNLILECHADPDLPAIIADRNRVNQILGNLLHNACKYTPNGGSVIVHAQMASTAGNAVIISVRDTGIGIVPSEQERIFEYFYRSPSQRRIHEGMGIGLALARDIARAHGGELTVSSHLNHGANFVLILPVAGPSAAPPQTAQPDRHRSTQRP